MSFKKELIHPKIAFALNRYVKDELIKDQKGAVRDWNKETADEFKHIFDTNLEKLLFDKYFLNLEIAKPGVISDRAIYPIHVEDILAIYEERKKRPLNLVILIEGIGSGKTTVYSIVNWLEWFRLTCTYNPHNYYGIMKDELIAFIAMNRSEKQAKRVTLQKVFPKFKTPFNMDYFPPHPRRGQEIYIERNHTVIFAGTSSAASALGYNVFGGCVDESNYLETVDNSKRVQSATDKYDAAEEMHDAIFGRMMSRFLNPNTGRLDGMLFMISSSKYPNDFLERKAKEHFKLGDNSHIFVRRRTLWEAKPKWYFSGITVPFSLKEKKVMLDESEINVLKIEGEKIMQERAKKRLIDNNMKVKEYA